MGDPLHPFDLTRMLFGAAPPLIYFELALRCIVIYLYALFALRYIAGRSGAQVSIVEMLMVMAMGAAIGGGLLAPEVPVFHILAVVTVIALINRSLDTWIIQSRDAKKAVDGEPICVVRDGQIRSETIEKREMGVSELQALLRIAGVTNLGQVRAAYIEPHGQLSLFRYDTPKPGLRIEPPPELDELVEADADETEGTLACITCGHTETAPVEGDCPECGNSDRTLAD